MIVDEQGNKLPVVLVGVKYGVPFTEEFDSIEEAISIAEYAIDEDLYAPVGLIIQDDVVRYHGVAYDWTPPTSEQATEVRRYAEAAS